MLNFRLIAKIIGALWVALAAVFLIPGIYATIGNQHSIAQGLVFFIISGALSIFGLILWYLNRNQPRDFNIKNNFFLVTFAWLSACFIGALPYYFTASLPDFAACFFESTSGFTGTGSSALTDIEATSQSILLWRALTQWLGGIGVVVFFIALLPLLGIGVTGIFRTESTGTGHDKIAQRVNQAAKRIWSIYFGLTIVLVFLLHVLGMDWFNAVCHALTTIATGGFSTKNAGVAAFESAGIDYVLAFFMIMASTNFAVHFRLFTSNKTKNLVFGSEVKAYYLILIGAVLLLTLSLYLGEWTNLSTALRASFFTVAATISSTGFTHFDYISFPLLSQAVLVALMVMGGMSGSTAGGVKCIRVVSAAKLVLAEFKKTLHPQALVAVKINNKVLKDNIGNTIWGFLFLYFAVLTLVTIFLAAKGFDLLSAATVTISMLSNIGPAFGEYGPFASFAQTDATTKFVLAGTMLIGRLEFFAVLVLFTRSFWRKY